MNNLHISFTEWILLCSIFFLSACTATERVEPASTHSLSPTSTNGSLAQDISTPMPTMVETSTKPAQTITITPRELVTITPEFTAEKTPNIAPIPGVTNTATLFEGPLIAFRVQNGQNYLLFLDIGTLTFREVEQEYLDIPFNLEWLDSGCHLYMHGNVIDLQGNVIERTNDPEDGNEFFQVPFLSPDKKMGVREVFLGSHKEIELDYLSLEILDRTNPDLQITLAPNGGAYAYSWSPDGNWLAFSDYDENFVLQVYRATSDGRVIEQLTFHRENPGVINVVEWSPNGQNIAYAVSAHLSGQSEAGHEGWVGLISLPDSQTAIVTPDNFVYTEGMWWSEDGSRIAFTGQGFPNVSSDAQLQGMQTQIHWADGSLGTILNSFYEEQAPTHSFNLVMPVGNLDNVFFAAKDGYYLLDATTNSYEKILNDIQADGLIRDFITSPFDFPGEADCPIVKQ